MKRFKEIWSSLKPDDRGLLGLFAAVFAVALLWTVTVAYGYGYADGYDAAKTPHIPTPTFDQIIGR